MFETAHPQCYDFTFWSHEESHELIFVSAPLPIGKSNRIGLQIYQHCEGPHSGLMYTLYTLD